VALPIRTGFRPPGLRPPISETPEPQPGEERIHCWDEAETVLVFVPGGEYTLGSEKAGETARPFHRVRLSPFWLAKVPVTNEQYARFLQANPGVREPSYWDDHRFNGPRQPVVGVSWDEARAYCLWAGLRLPSEAQWEAAARGREARRFPWGTEEPTSERVNFAHNVGQTSPVGSYPQGAGPFGTLDQAGNIWEWCEDAWEKTIPLGWERTPDPVFTRGLPGIRVLRGGAWDSRPWAVVAASRHRDEAILRSWVVGFRCVLPGPLARRFPVDGH
jgi:formylglycine-generating enzyme required for sulfatase activity